MMQNKKYLLLYEGKAHKNNLSTRIKNYTYILQDNLYCYLLLGEHVGHLKTGLK